MLLVQKWPFFQLFFLANIGQKSAFYDILERENACLGYKNKEFKQSKNSDFSKGVNPWFWSKKCPIFRLFFRQYRPGKCLLRYSRTKKRLSRLLRRRVQKVEKLRFFQRGYSMLLVQKWPYFQLFFLGNIGQKNVF